MSRTNTNKRSRSSSPHHPSKRAKLPSRTLPVKFLIFSDTHGTVPALAPCDVLLHCGDLTEDGSPASLRHVLRAIGKAEAELKLVIAGNHEICLDEPYYTGEGGSKKDCEEASCMIAADPDSEASRNGVVFLGEGTHTFTLESGATFRIYASPYTPRYGASAFQYDTVEDRFNPPGGTLD